MTGIIPKFIGGPVTYQVSAKVTAGSLVAADGAAAKTVSTAGAASVLVLGVALIDAIPAASVTALADNFGNNIMATNAYPEHTTVAGPGYIVPVTFAANTAFGAYVKAAAAGAVTPWVSGTDDASLIIGKCVEPGGVVIATNAKGLLRIGL